ncbi:low molecular weight phosphatase family protein [Promicromonospora sp. NPDC057138]|uniref:arsenate-mycothiol transferase ArsC n=1 Tax=Promicromonospora sp. NPDC057138 TaxID=3346031 RepID=UPI0036327E92
MPFTVLTVCTGNICRSPAVETLLRHVLDASVTVGSAGTNALVGHPIAEPMARLLAANGFPPADFAARQLTPELISGADLVLTLTPAHRAWVVDRVPAAVRRTLTVMELGRLSSTLVPGAVVGQDDAARLAALVSAALLERPRHAGRHHDDGVVDPYGRSAAAYRRSYDQILEALTPIMNALRAEPPGGAEFTRGAQ